MTSFMEFMSYVVRRKETEDEDTELYSQHLTTTSASAMAACELVPSWLPSRQATIVR